MTMFVGCHKDDPEEEDPVAERTVLIYMAAQNNLSYWPGSGYRFADADLKEIKQAIKNLGDDHLVIYVDKAQDPVASYDDHKPYLLHYRKGELRDSIPMDSTAMACDPTTFKTVAKKAVTDVPGKDYGIVSEEPSGGMSPKHETIVLAREVGEGFLCDRLEGCRVAGHCR